MSLLDKLSGLIGVHDDYVKDDGDPKGEVPCWVCNGLGFFTSRDSDGELDEDECLDCNGKGSIADAEASIDYQHPDAPPSVTVFEDVESEPDHADPGLDAVRKLEGEVA